MSDISTVKGKIEQPDSPMKWGSDAPRGAKTVVSRIVKEGATVPLFIGQTLINALRDLGYNDTTSAVCEFVDNSIQWGASEIRVYFHETGKKGNYRINVLVVDDGNGMAPNVLRAATAFGGSMCFDNRSDIGRYGMGMKGAALSMGSELNIISWQESRAFYEMTLNVDDIGEDKSNSVTLPVPQFANQLPPEVVNILTSEMVFPQHDQQLVLANDPARLIEALGESGTIIFVPDCDRLTYRKARTLAEDAIKEMSRVYRRFLAQGLKLYINNRRVEPFDPTYSMPEARHVNVEGLEEKFSRVISNWTIPVAVSEDSTTTMDVTARLFLLPSEWEKLPKKVLKNDLHVFDTHTVSFMRANREVYAGGMKSITGKFWSGDVWWRMEIEFPAELDEAFGVAVNKQGVRPKKYVTETIRKKIHEDLRKLRQNVEERYARRAAEAHSKGMTEAERRANEAEALQTSLLPQEKPRNEEEERLFDEKLKTLAVSLKRKAETDEEAYDRIKASHYVTAFKHDEDAPFYRVDFQLGKVILSLNSAHPFFTALYEPLGKLSSIIPARRSDSEEEEDDFFPTDVIRGLLPSLELLLLSLARTQSALLAKNIDGEYRALFDHMRKQWSLDLATQLEMS